MDNTVTVDSRRFKLHYLYYFLAGFDLLTIVISLVLSNQILSIYSASVVDHRQWSSWQVTTSQLSEVAARVNAPGNDVFTSGQPDEERRRLEWVWREYLELAGSLKNSLRALPGVQARALLEHLDNSDSALERTRDEALKIFAHMRNGETEEAGQAMSRMDQNFAQGLSSLLQLSRAMSDLQVLKLNEESNRAKGLAKYELAIMVLVVCMVSLALYYGHILAARAVKDEQKRNDMQLALFEASRKAGMADMASGVLHNVGNVLNSVNVSTASLQQKVRQSRAARIDDVLGLLDKNRDELASYVTSEPGQRLLAYLKVLSTTLQGDNELIGEELRALAANVEHINRIVQMQQSVAAMRGISESFDIVTVIEDAIRINQASLNRHEVIVERDYQSRSIVTGDRHKVIQILVNLVGNARYAVCAKPDGEKRIVIRVSLQGENLLIQVQDHGVGIAAEDQTRIFSHGFTTKGEQGHGFGLHSSALAATEMHGKLTAFSKGLGHGACFTLILPVSCQDIKESKVVRRSTTGSSSSVCDQSQPV